MKKLNVGKYVNPVLRDRRFTTGLLVACGVLIFLLFKGCGEQRSTNALYLAAQDTLKLERNDKGQLKATISIMEGRRKKDLLRFETKDSTILWLKEIVKAYEGRLNSATAFTTVTTSFGTSSTNIIGGDTVWKDSLIFVYPTYETEWDDKWGRGSIIAKRESIFRDIKVRNEYEMTQGFEKQGFLKKKLLLVSIKNLNPNTEVLELRTYSINRNKGNRFGLDLNVSYGIGSNFVLKPYIGLGVGYRIMSF